MNASDERAAAPAKRTTWVSMLQQTSLTKLFTSAATFTGFVLYVLAWPPERIDPLNVVHQELRAKGYHVLADATNATGAGMIVSLEEVATADGSTRVVVHPACNYNKDEMSALGEVSAARSYSVDVPQTWQEKAFDLVFSKLGIGSAQASARTLSFESPQVHLMTAEHLYTLRQSLLTGSCEKAVIWNLEAGATVCQISRAYKASVHVRHAADDSDDVIVDDKFVGITPDDRCLKLNDFNNERVAMM